MPLSRAELEGWEGEALGEGARASWDRAFMCPRAPPPRCALVPVLPLRASKLTMSPCHSKETEAGEDVTFLRSWLLQGFLGM